MGIGAQGTGYQWNNPQPIWYSGLNVSSSQLDLPIPIFWGQRRLSTNAIWYGNFEKHSANGKGKGALTKGSNQNYTYTAATITALCEGVVDSIARAWSSGSTTTTATLSELNQTFFSGTATQTPWSYTLTNYPTQARAYARTAYLASPKQQLGSSASIPDNAYECVRQNGFAYVQTSEGWIDPATHVQYTAIDCLMSDIITDLLTNTQYGLGFTSADLGSMTQYAAYQRAQGFFFSPLLNQQSKGTEILDRWAQISNSWIYWDGTGFQFVPLGDSAVTGNGVTYTPDLSPAYALGLDDYLSGSSPAGAPAKAGKEPPLKVTIVSEFDAKNTTRLTITDRTIGYVSNPFEWKDQDLVDLYGVHDSGSVSGDDICCPAVGTLVCQLIGKRNAYIRRTYAWKSSYRLIRLLPGSIVTLTEPNIGLNAARVRIRKVSEADDGSLEFEAEEMP